MPRLYFKSTVTRRTDPTPVPSDLDERLEQLKYHQAAEAAETVQAIDAAPIAEAVTDRDPEKPKRDPNGLQHPFLEAHLSKPVTVFLINGVKLIGTLRQFDQYCIVLEGTYDIESMIFKHTISTIAPASR